MPIALGGISSEYSVGAPAAASNNQIDNYLMKETLQKCIEETTKKLVEQAKDHTADVQQQPDFASQVFMPQANLLPRDSPLGILLRDKIRPVSKVLKYQYEFNEMAPIETSAAFIEKVKARCQAFGFNILVSLCGFTGTFS